MDTRKYKALATLSLVDKLIVAKDAKTPAEVLAELSKDEHEWVREYVAGNANTPIEVLAELSKDEYKWVREYVAGNANTPIEVLAELAKDEHEWVRRAVARTPSRGGFGRV